MYFLNINPLLVFDVEIYSPKVIHVLFYLCVTLTETLDFNIVTSE